MNKLTGKVLSSLIEWRGYRILDRYLKKIQRQGLRQFQEEVLLSILTDHQGSEFTKKYNLDKVQGIDQFRETFELSDYEVFRPYIDRVKKGEVGALFSSREKLHMFALTSGTTGKPKYIPVTTSFFKEYKEGSKIWGAVTAKEFRGQPLNKILILFSPLQEELSESGIPCGAVSGLISRNQGKLVGPLFGAPFEASLFPSSSDRQYAVLRAAAENKIGLISTANPSTLISFAELIGENAGQLITDLRSGLLKGKPAPFPLKRVPAKADALERILKEKGCLKPADIWPDLKMLACWKGGTLFHYLEKIPEHYGEIETRDLGLLASEGRFSIPIFSNRDDGLLNVFHHFLEFIPEEHEDQEKKGTVLADEIRVGKRYFLVTTSSSGLYRYQLNDLIEVTDIYKGVPMIKFLNKGKYISSLTGEKITELQVLNGFHGASPEKQESSVYFRFFPTYHDRPHYKVYIEEKTLLLDDPNGFINLLDQNLCEQNIEYASKRGSGRLAGLELHWVKTGTFSDEQKNHTDRSNLSRFI